MSGESWYSTIIREAVEGTSAADAVNAVMPGGMAVAGAVKAAADAAVGLGAVGSWSFDREEIEAIIADWKELAEQLKEDRAAFDAFRSAVIKPPSEDTPTDGFVRALAEGVSGLDNSNYSMVQYTHSFIEKLESAMKGIEQQDEEGVSAIGSGTVGES
jgi:hypothetical protein